MMQTKVLPGLLLLSMLLGGCNQTPAPQQLTEPETTDSAVLPPAQMLSAAQQQQFEQAKQIMRSGDYAAAQALLHSLATTLPQASGVAYNLALCQWHGGDITAARQTLTQLLSAVPLYSDGHNLAGVLARQQGEFRQAERHFQQALQVQPDYATAHKNLAFLYELYLGAPLQAHFHYKHYIDLTQDEQAKIWLALLEQQLAQEQAND